MSAPSSSAFPLLVEEAAATLRQGQGDLLRHFWRLGELADRLQREIPDRTLRHLAEALRDHGQEVSASQLQQARRIFDRYRAEELPALVERGFTISHLKALLPLDEALRERLEQAAVGEDGRAIPARALREAVRAERIRALAEEPPADDQPVAEPWAARHAQLPTAQVCVTAAGDGETGDDGGPLIAEGPPAQASGTAAEAPAIRVGAVATRDFSRPPLAVLRRATGAAEALADALPNLWTALGEAQRIGWDSERAQRNFRDQAELLITAFDGLRQVAPAAIERLRSALRG